MIEKGRYLNYAHEDDMKTISQLLLLLTVVAGLAACVDADGGKMQGGSQADKVTGYKHGQNNPDQ
ncbi:hypothetical protein CRENPOLYSF1_1180025 [Crenothrix polyspora]|jgi:hypothetical protein|uniref:Uncharacterized protein n=1 Tax=Crenothrix polyspora TaxID=360316 RepID=A0A1R4H0X6_9GAMM|nr:hypothetical protein CRENPOLYSF1_1180025 [Crenothrix polyspora]